MGESRKKRILFVVTEDWYFLSHRVPLALEAKENGYEVALLTNITEHEKDIKALDIKLFPWRLNRGSFNPYHEFRSLFSALKVLKEYRPDLLHAVAMKPVIYGSFLCGVLGLKSKILALAGLGYVFRSKSFKALILKPVLALCLKLSLLGKKTLMIVQNKDDKLCLEDAGVPGEKIKIIRGSGVDIGRFSPNDNPKKELIVLLPARLLWDKGIKDFFLVADRLKRKGVTAVFQCAGDRDPHNPECIPESVIKEWSSIGSLEFLGRVEFLESLYRRASIVCLPSYH